MPQISVPQKNMILQIESGKNLMDALIEAGLPVASSCLGEGICSKCAVEATPAGVPSELETITLARNKQDSGKRLSCQMHITADVIVKTSYW